MSEATFWRMEAERHAEPCNARHDDVTSIVCHLPKGHRRDHEGIEVVRWVQDDRFCATHGRAHWDDGDRTCRWTDDPAGGSSLLTAKEGEAR